MKKTLAIVVLFLTTLTSWAQFPGAPAGGKGGQQIPNMGHIYGKVTDTAGKPMEGASVVLLQNKFDTVTKKRKEILLKGIVTKANGEFSFAELPIMATLKIKISATGFVSYESPVAFQMKMPAGGGQPTSSDPAASMNALNGVLNSFEKDLGNIKLTIDVKQLQAVTVTGSKPLLKMDIDKKVFNVEKNLVSAGGTAVSAKITAQDFWQIASGKRYGAGDFFAYDATNLRVREMSFGYQIPIRNTNVVKGAKLSVVGRNLLWLYRGKSLMDIPGVGKRKMWMDPDMSLGNGNFQGVEYGTLPATRSIGLNLQVTF